MDDVDWNSFLWQLLSGNFLKGYGKDVINIHHGLLPSFKGRNPVKQVSEFFDGSSAHELCYLYLACPCLLLF